MPTIRGFYVGHALDVILERYAYPVQHRYALWEDLRLFARNNFDEYLTSVLRYYADSILPEYVRYDIFVRSEGFNPEAQYTIAIDDPQYLDFFRTGDVTFRSNHQSFSFRFGMPTTDIFHSPYELKRFIDSIKANFVQHATSLEDAIIRRDMLGRAWGFGADFHVDEIARDNTRARELLLSQCTDDQVREYKNNKSITVYGGITGNKYRIRHAYQINVDVMEGNRVMYRLCTVADPVLNEDMPIEDNMLAQKTMIELNEQEFLQTAIRWEK